MAIPALGLELFLGSNGGGWNTAWVHALYEGVGWVAFLAWSTSFYPQLILNYRRKSVSGLNFDFLLLNLTKHTAYLIFNASIFFSATVQQQYHSQYGADQLLPVSASDVAFSIHAVLLTALTGLQILFYDRGGQRLSVSSAVITGAVWTLAAVLLLVAAPGGRWLWLVTAFNYIQLAMTSIKYIPQAWFNYKRKSTVGWSISNILLDITGGLMALVQMIIFSLDQRTVTNFTGNVGKVGLSFETIAFDTLFIVQHYVLFSERSPIPTYHAIDADESKDGVGNNKGDA